MRRKMSSWAGGTITPYTTSSRTCADRPRVYPCLRGEVRRHFGRPFPYALIYVDEPQGVLVLAIAHFKRRPGYWLHRLEH